MQNKAPLLFNRVTLQLIQEDLSYLVVTLAEEVVSEALSDGGADPEDLGHVLPSDQHVAVVQLHVHIWLFIQ